jgi:predicted enzyme related to lactoylglutathione lyase
MSVRWFVPAIVAAAFIPAAAHAQSSRPDSTMPNVRIQSFSVIVPDYDEAKRWYEEKLGFATITDQRFGAGERFVLVAPAGQRDVGIVLQIARRPAGGDSTMPSDYSDRIGKIVNVVLRTNDVTAYAEGLRARGVALTTPPTQRAWGGEAGFKDLYGNSFVVVGPLKR